MLIVNLSPQRIFTNWWTLLILVENYLLIPLRWFESVLSGKNKLNEYQFKAQLNHVWI